MTGDHIKRGMTTFTKLATITLGCIVPVMVLARLVGGRWNNETFGERQR